MERRTEAKSDTTMSWQSFAVRNQSLLDGIRAAPSATIVMITISSAPPREDGQQAWLVVERERLSGPVDRSDWPVLLSESAQRDSPADNSATKEWRKTISDWSAKKLEEPLWEQYTEQWNLSRDQGMASIADGLNSLQGQWHELMLGRPVEFASATVGLSSPAGAVLSSVVSEHALPGDTSIKDLKRVIQVTGIVAGFATGNLHMAHACLTSYMRDRAIEIVSEELVKTFRGEPEREFTMVFGEGADPKDGGKSRDDKPLQEPERHYKLDDHKRRYGPDELEWDELER